jgi:hypothetical protein
MHSSPARAAQFMRAMVAGQCGRPLGRPYRACATHLGCDPGFRSQSLAPPWAAELARPLYTSNHDLKKNLRVFVVVFLFASFSFTRPVDNFHLSAMPPPFF